MPLAPRWTAGAALLAALVHAQPAIAAQAARALDDGIYAEVQSKRGERLYAENCASCHASDLSGTELAPPVDLRLLASGRWSGKSLAELFDLMRFTMPLNSPGGLSAAQNADILAFMLQRGKYPSGGQELAGTADLLRGVTIQPRRR